MGPAHGDPIQRTKTQARVGPARCEKSCGTTVWKNKPDGNVIFWWTSALMADPFPPLRRAFVKPGIADARDIAFKQGGHPKLPSYQLKYLCLHSFRHSGNKWNALASHRRQNRSVFLRFCGGIHRALARAL